MADLDLFAWWAISITFGSIFLTLVSIYLYTDSRANHKGNKRASLASLLKAFAFVWILLGLLIFYIISVHIGYSYIFAVGNVIVEVLLIAYLLKNKTDSSEQT